MQYHKIPQHVIGYQGRIVGKFTAHQFVYLAIGGIIIFLIFTSQSLPRTFMIGGIATTALLTALFALVKYEGRSTDAWLVTFIHTITMPTQMIWIKENPIPDYLDPLATFIRRKKKQAAPRVGEEKIDEFIRRFSETTRKSDLDKEEEAFIKRLNFNLPSPSSARKTAEDAAFEKTNT